MKLGETPSSSRWFAVCLAAGACAGAGAYLLWRERERNKLQHKACDGKHGRHVGVAGPEVVPKSLAGRCKLDPSLKSTRLSKFDTVEKDNKQCFLT